MFLYFNHQGELTTSIPHGEIPRQGNPLSVYVAVDKAFFKNKNPNTPLGWALKVAVVSETEMAESFPMTYLGLEIFKKKNGSEITYDLVENTPYHMYYQKIPAEYSTAEFGDKRLIVSFYRKQLLNDGTFSDSVVEYYNNEACDLHIEKTYGNASVPITISKNQYKIIQEKLNNLTVSKQDKNLFNGTTVKNLSKAFDYFCSGNSTIVCYNEYLMQVISVDAHDDERHIYGLFNDTIFKFNFNVNDPTDLLIHPEKVDISEGLSSSIGIFPIDEILSESEIKELYNTKENGKYSVKSEEYGDEIIIIYKEKELFKRFTAGYDYTFDFELDDWVVASGGGGGGGGGNIVLTAKTPLFQTIGLGKNAKISYFYKPPVGTSGSVKYYVNDVIKASENIESGENTFDVANFLTQAITYNIKVEVNDSTGNKAELIFVFDVISLSITSLFDDSTPRYGDVRIDYRSLGNVEKTSHIFIDGVENKELSETFNDTEKFVMIEKLPHGVHKIEIFVSAVINEIYVESNTLSYNVIFVDLNADEVLISSKFNTQKATQGDIISIDYIVVDPEAPNSAIGLWINDQNVQNLVVDRKKQYWTITDYPVGNVKFSIKTINSEKDFYVNVIASDVVVNPIKTHLSLELTANNKNNSSADRSVWKFNDITANLIDFNWGTNGWINNPGSIPFLRLNGSAKVEIPFNIFATDFLEFGKTIEFDFATTNVYDINKILITSFADDKGFKLTANECLIKSEQAEVSTKFKEDERIKISFVIQTIGSNRLIKTFINGIVSGLEQYSTTDNFTQNTPVGITINPNNGDIDIYSIRVYDAPLTDNQVLNNYIADLTQAEKVVKNRQNNIFDSNNNVDYNKVKQLIPVLIVTGPELPADKGDKKNVRVDYVDTLNPNRNFTYENVVWDVQGTSSVGYPRKNWKGKFPQKFSFYEGAIEENTYTFKADYMESSHSHNTGNAVFINSIAPKFPTQVGNEKVRNTIYGYPIVMFYRKTLDSALEYQGVYNFNNDKGNANTIGLTTDKSESWEFKNNTSARCNFRSNDFINNVAEDFEARYPDKYTNYTALSRVVSWVYSTDGNIEKFKEEFNQYFNLDACLFYYTMLDVMLASDSRAKNMFLDTTDGLIWYPRWYDIDTCYGLDNNGFNKFNYGLEQHDVFGSGYVYNGHDSLLWNNFEEAFEEEIEDYYVEMRRTGKLSYEAILSVLKEKQIDAISEAMYNTDGDFKYVGPLIEENDGSFLYVSQGSRLNHLQWWLSNRFRYLDSKYKYTDYTADDVYMKIYSPSGAVITPNPSFTVTPFIDTYASIKYASYNVQVRTTANTPTLVAAPNINDFVANDSEVFIYGASQLTDLGDLSNKYIGTNDFTKATKIKRLIIGNGTAGYKNENLQTLSIGNNTMLEVLDVQNCPNLTTPIDLTGCNNIREVYAKGSSITTALFTDGSNLEKLQLPATVTNLRLVNQPFLDYFTMEGYTNLKTLYLSGVSSLNTKSILNSAVNLTSVYVDGINWNMSNSEIKLLDRLYEISNCELVGTITISGDIGRRKLQRWSLKWPNLVISTNAVDDFVVNFYNYDGTVLLQTVEVLEGETAVYTGETPTRPDYDGYGYTFYDWSDELTNITEDKNVYADFVYDKPSSWTWEITEDGLQVSMSVSMLYTTSVLVVDWGDNNIQEFNGSYASLSHTYANAGTFEIKIFIGGPGEIKNNKIEKIYFNNKTISKISENSVLYLQDRVEMLEKGGTSEETVVVDEFYISKTLKNINGYLTIKANKIYFKGSLDNWLDLEFDHFYNNPIQSYSDFYIDGEKIPETLNINKEKLNSYTFQNVNSIKNVYFGEKVKIIPSIFFKGSSIENVHVSKKIEQVGDAFGDCHNLNEFYYYGNYSQWLSYSDGQSVSLFLKIFILDENNNFVNIKELQDIVIPADIEKIGSYKFYQKENLNSIIFEKDSKLKVIENGAFESSALSGELVLPDSLEEIRARAFTETKLSNVVLPKTLKKLEQYSFYKAKIENIEIPSSVQQIGNSCFLNCHNLTNVILNEGLTTIGELAFEYTKLEIIKIPSTVTQLGTLALANCEKLKTVVMKSKIPPTTGYNCFIFTPALEEIRVPAESVEAYKTATNWKNYASLIVADPEEEV